jgi:hypothetical protein
MIGYGGKMTMRTDHTPLETAISRVTAATDTFRDIALTGELAPGRPSEAVSKHTGYSSVRRKIDGLRADAAECIMISSLATDSQKRVFFEKLAAHLTELASEVEALLG